MDTVTIYFPNGMLKETIQNCRVLCCVDGILEISVGDSTIKRYSGFLYEITKPQNSSANINPRSIANVLKGIG